MPPHEPSKPRPRVVRGGREDHPGRERGNWPSAPGSESLRGRDGWKPFLRPGIWTLVASLALVVVTGVVTLRVVRSRGAPAQPEAEIFRALGSRPLDASPAAASGAPRAATPFPVPESLSPPARASLALVEEIERGHADGTWSVARKRFEPCPDEDVERVAWIDVWSRILKMTGTRPGEGEPVRVEQWYDRDGRLRAVRAARAAAAAVAGWDVGALLDERGTVVHRAASGAAPALESLRLTMGDPSRAFFERPRCDAAKK